MAVFYETQEVLVLSDVSNVENCVWIFAKSLVYNCKLSVKRIMCLQFCRLGLKS